MSSLEPQRGGSREGEPLTDSERDQVSRLLSDPFSFPQEFFQWIRARLETDQPLFTAAAIFGFRSQVASIAAAGATTFPVGTIVDYDGTTDPGSGWILYDGRLLNRTTYALLYAIVGFRHSGGADPGSNQFRIGDGQGRTRVQKGTNTDVDALGENDGLALASRSPKHNSALTGAPGISDPGHGHNLEKQAFVAGGADTLQRNTGVATELDGSLVRSNTTGITANVGTLAVGPGGSRPTDTAAFIVVNSIIYTGV